MHFYDNTGIHNLRDRRNRMQISYAVGHRRSIAEHVILVNVERGGHDDGFLKSVGSSGAFSE